MDISTEKNIIDQFINKIKNHIRMRFKRIVVGGNNPRIPIHVSSCRHECHDGVTYDYNTQIVSPHAQSVTVTYNAGNISIYLGLYGKQMTYNTTPDIVIKISIGNFFEVLDDQLDEKIGKYIDKQKHLFKILTKQLNSWESSIALRNESPSTQRKSDLQSDFGNIL